MKLRSGIGWRYLIYANWHIRVAGCRFDAGIRYPVVRFLKPFVRHYGIR